MIKKMKNIGMYAFLILVTFISVFPLYWMVSASTNKSVDVSRGVLSFGSHLGENLKNLLANQDVGAALVNSFICNITYNSFDGDMFLGGIWI